MPRLTSRAQFELWLAWLMLGILLLFTYVWFFQVPYAGFSFAPSGRVVRVYVTATPMTGLQSDDRLVQVGSISWSDFAANQALVLFENVRPGQVVPITVERGGQMRSIPWLFPGMTRAEVLERLNSGWFLPYLFWAAGILTLFLLRPKDERWRLLLAFDFLTALWLAMGGVSRSHIGGSALMLRMAIWLAVPVYWHLHWVFPKSFRRLPIFVWRGAYLAALVLAVAEGFQLVSPGAYYVGFLLALLGSLLLLIGHFIYQPSERRTVGLIGLAMVLALLPSVAFGVISAFGQLPNFAPGALLTLPVIPLMYLYAASRRNLGGLEIRANRLVSAFIFLPLLATLFLVLIPFTDVLLEFPGKAGLIGIAASMAAVLITLFGFPRFQHFVERRLLGMPLLPQRLVEMYANRIVASLDTPGLVRLLTDEILPSLLVRQFVFLSFDEAHRSVTLCALGVAPDQVPGDREVPALLVGAGQYRPLGLAEGAPEALAWVRLVLPLYVGGGHPIGLWLLGRRDPDDFYAQAEIPTLQALANQTAVALSHIRQTERLRALHQASIDRHETERANLAHELHDEVLNQLAAMNMIVDVHGPGLRFREAYGSLTQRIRQTIGGLRPAMLSYGLRPALDQLADELSDRAGGAVRLSVEVEASEARYAPQMEQHLYRIVQQACENALKHGRPQVIRISGLLEAGQLELTVEDDGVGFAAGAPLDLTRLLAHKHFGLAGMYERAALIHARMELDSEPGRGTRVRLTWMADDHAD